MLVACRKLPAISGDFSAWVKLLQDASISWIDVPHREVQVLGRHRKLVHGVVGETFKNWRRRGELVQVFSSGCDNWRLICWIVAASDGC
jgi:hypothetical protein